jgi:hypothetical protein
MVTDKYRSGRPATNRTEKSVAKVRPNVRETGLLTVRSIAQQASINRESVKKILIEDLDMRKVCKNGPEAPTHMALSVRELSAGAGKPSLFTGSSPH